jgi:hypothetical protein
MVQPIEWGKIISGISKTLTYRLIRTMLRDQTSAARGGSDIISAFYETDFIRTILIYR